MTINTSMRKLSLALALSVASAGAVAASLSPGDVLNAGNIGQRLQDTFEGYTIESLLTETQQRLIQEEELVITLKASEPVQLGRDYVAATEKYSDQVSFNPETRLMEGWVAGIPFPDVTEDTENAAEKLMWNHHVAQPTKNYQDYSRTSYLFVDDKDGLERRQEWVLKRFYLKGRLGEEETEIGDGDLLFKQLLYATYPNDIRGLGLFTVRYDSPQLDDSWAYLKSVRRTRRLSGGTWMDPIGGTDQLNDDLEIFNAHPTWYPEYKLLGKRKLLVVAHSQTTSWDTDASGTDEFPIVDLDNEPYWNPQDEWEPRDVWVIEATAPPEHPYSKKVMYMDVEFPRFYMADVYDKKGEFWKWLNFHLKTFETEDGDVGIVSVAGFVIDYQRRHSTIFVQDPEVVRLNTPGIDPDDISLRQLERAAER
ncbi:MAG: outer membrane lipoprotein-sorting protein [Oleibacter sp.]|nr:outer membrane lipoprotein-sorting protein [Thalassolituus sp.]